MKDDRVSEQVAEDAESTKPPQRDQDVSCEPDQEWVWVYEGGIANGNSIPIVG